MTRRLPCVVCGRAGVGVSGLHAHCQVVATTAWADGYLAAAHEVGDFEQDAVEVMRRAGVALRQEVARARRGIYDMDS